MEFSIIVSYIIYSITFITAAFFASLYAKSKKVSKYLFFFLAISIPALLASIRGIGVGVDYIEYVRHINEIINIDSISSFSVLDSNMEFGFNFIIYLFSRFTDYFPVIVFFIYAFMSFFVVKACKNLFENEFVFWGYLFYLATFWLFGFNGLRQAIAIAIVFYSFTYIKERNIYLFILTIILAMFFHKTAIVVAPLYFMINLKNKNKGTIVFIITILGVVLGAYFLEQTSSILGYEGYLTSKYVQDSRGTAILKIFQSLILLFPFLIWQKKLTRINPFNKLYFRTLYLNITTLILAVQITQATRLMFYFEIATIITAVEIIKYYTKHRNKTYTLFLIYGFLYFIVYKFIYIYATSGGVIPYSLLKLN